VQKQKGRHVYTKDHALCQDLLPKSTEGEARTVWVLQPHRAWKLYGSRAQWRYLAAYDADLKVQGNLVMESDADRIAIRYSRIRADPSIHVSITGDGMVRHANPSVSRLDIADRDSSYCSALLCSSSSS
jgi:hypothetical protein